MNADEKDEVHYKFLIKYDIDVERNSAVSRNHFEYIINVKLLNASTPETFYTPKASNKEVLEKIDGGIELGNKNFYTDDRRKNYIKELISKNNYVVELSIDSVKLNLPDQLKAAAKLRRTIVYRYDWTELIIDAKGKPIGIANKSEIQQRWEKIKDYLLNRYTGIPTEIYIEKLDQVIYTKEAVFADMYNYDYFALIFPAIPIDHSKKWKQKRQVGLSESLNPKFTETITFEKEIGNKMYYNITGDSNIPGNYKVLKYEGTLVRSKDNFLPDSVNVVVDLSAESVNSTMTYSVVRIDD